MLKLLIGIVLVVLVAIVAYTGGHIEVGSPQVRTAEIETDAGLLSVKLGKAELLTHTYLWGVDGPFTKEYEIKVYLRDSLVIDRPGITHENVEGALSGLANRYQGIMDLINHPLS